MNTYLTLGGLTGSKDAPPKKKAAKKKSHDKKPVTLGGLTGDK